MPFIACPMPAKMTAAIITCGSACETGPAVIKYFFIINSAEHELYPANKCYIFTFISMINTKFKRLKARNYLISRYLSFSEQLKFRA